MNKHEKMVGKHGDVLRVVVLGRVSTIHQDIGNLEAGYAYAEKFLDGISDKPVIFKRFGEQCSGMIVDRESLNQVSELIENGWADVVLMEDLSKVYRNPRWIYNFVQNCVDSGVRIIAPGDRFDTWSDDWELMLGAASLRHGMHIPDTRRRVRRTATNSFHKGGMVQKIRFGYRKLTPSEAKALPGHPDNLLIARIPECTSIIKELWHMIVEGRLYGKQIVDWLEENGVKPGPYVKTGKWTWEIVKDLLEDDILIGWRTFRRQRFEPIFSTGKHRRENNDAPEREHLECLAHLTADEFAALQKALDELKPDHERNTGADHPRFGVRRKDSVFPQQHAICKACGALVYVSGDGVAKCMNTTKDAKFECWNHVQIDLELTRCRIVDFLLARLKQHSKALTVMMTVAWQQLLKSRANSGNQVQALDKQIANLEKEKAALFKAIKAGVPLEGLKDEAGRVQQSLIAATLQRDHQLRRREDTPIPTSFEQFETNPRELLLELARGSYEFATLMRRVIPRFEIQPVQALDTGQVRPRAKLTIDFSAASRKSSVPLDISTFETVEIDLFEPPVHIKHMNEVVALKQSHPQLSLKKLALLLEPRVSYMTVKRSWDYWNLMQAQGMSEPYRVLHEAPSFASRWKKRTKSVSSADKKIA